ncbi:MAG: SUMF1/EgtB/PvdO family nonheme iron enzyme [Pirellulaceae bacterium]
MIFSLLAICEGVTRVALALMVAGTAYAPSYAAVVSFGSGVNQFNMEFVTIGNPGNTADITGVPNPAGAVGYEYGIGKFEVSRDMITKYNANYGTANNLATTLYDMESNGIAGGNGANRPATGISWNEAARFVNWLNTSTGNQAAYKFTTTGVNDNIALWASGDPGYDASNPYRNSLAKYFLPSYNEWYKAAYFKPDSPTSTSGTYYDFANGSNTAPTAVASGTADNTAVYDQSFTQGPADVDQAGGLSPYGVMGLAAR